jgi:multiple sugar transport system ATP-binding protein
MNFLDGVVERDGATLSVRCEDQRWILQDERFHA